MGNVFNYGEQGLALGDFVAAVIASTAQCLGLTFPGQAIALDPLASPWGGVLLDLRAAQAWRDVPGALGMGYPVSTPPLAEPCPWGDLPLQRFRHRKPYSD